MTCNFTSFHILNDVLSLFLPGIALNKENKNRPILVCFYFSGSPVVVFFNPEPFGCSSP